MAKRVKAAVVATRRIWGHEMKPSSYRLAFCGFAGALFLAACVAPAKTTPTEIDPGQYELEKSHASLHFQVKHFGLSWYTMRFNEFDVALDFDTSDPESSSVEAIIDPTSIDVWHPEKKDDWNAELANDSKFLDAEIHPQIVFRAKEIEVTGETTGTLIGDLTMKGVTKPVTMDVTFNGSNAMPWAPGRKIVGFSASGTFNRSDFGMTTLLPNIVSDEVRFQIEIELQPTQ